jgi:hypothetical protein
LFLQQPLFFLGVAGRVGRRIERGKQEKQVTLVHCPSACALSLEGAGGTTVQCCSRLLGLPERIHVICQEPIATRARTELTI